MAKFKAVWFEGLSEEDKLALQKQLLASAKVLERLKEIIDTRTQRSYNTQMSKNRYDASNWALIQADYIGVQRTYKEISDIINLGIDI